MVDYYPGVEDGWYNKALEKDTAPESFLEEAFDSHLPLQM